MPLRNEEIRRRHDDQASRITVFDNKMDWPLRTTKNSNRSSVCVKCRSTTSLKSKRFFLLLLVLVLLSAPIGIIRLLVKRWNKNKADESLKEKPSFESTNRLHSSSNTSSIIDNDLRFACSLQNTINSIIASADSDETPHALARFILFQSNGAHQLLNFMTYYTQVIDIQHMVIINHQTLPSNADPRTNLLLQEYKSRGSDVWDCVGSFEYKSEMWSWVTRRYTHVSDFVFPLDIDEYIAVLTPSTSSISTSTPNTTSTDASQILSWNKEHLSKALHKLQDTGKPFKMERGDIYPVDCNIFQWEGESSRSDTMDQSNSSIQIQNSNLLNHYERSAVEKLKYVARKKHDRANCMDKVFFRGKDFNFTDTGNHHGQTHIQEFSVAINKCTALLDSGDNGDSSSEKREKYVQDTDQDSNLFMVHMQFITFEEWLMHALRGASDRGFNRFSNLEMCTKGMRSWEYCESWEMLMHTNFDPRIMQRMYREKVCAKLVNGTIPVPISQILYASKV